MIPEPQSVHATFSVAKEVGSFLKTHIFRGLKVVNCELQSGLQPILDLHVKNEYESDIAITRIDVSPNPDQPLLYNKRPSLRYEESTCLQVSCDPKQELRIYIHWRPIKALRANRTFGDKVWHFLNWQFPTRIQLNVEQLKAIGRLRTR